MTASQCQAHYPLLLDGFAVYCERYAGHPVNDEDELHENYTIQAPATMLWHDQPECWEDWGWSPIEYDGWQDAPRGED